MPRLSTTKRLVFLAAVLLAIGALADSRTPS